MDLIEYENISFHVQPWLKPDLPDIGQLEFFKHIKSKYGEKISQSSFVSKYALVFADYLSVGDRSYIALGTILRGKISIGVDTSINTNCTIVGNVTLGDKVRIAPNVSIYGFNHNFSSIEVPIMSQGTSSIGVSIGHDCWIGAGVIICDGVNIGDHCVIAAGSVVTRDFVDFSVAAGNPARLIRMRND